ncbi:MAG: hypothetical protein WDW36_001493 [Sanguina aurantia]
MTHLRSARHVSFVCWNSPTTREPSAVAVKEEGESAAGDGMASPAHKQRDPSLADGASAAQPAHGSLPNTMVVKKDDME